MYCVLTVLVRRFLKINDWGSVRIEDEEVYVLTYANDIVLIVKKKEEMLAMMSKLMEYLKLERREVELNMGNTVKIIRFKRKRKNKKDKVKMKRTEIEEIKEYKYV